VNLVWGLLITGAVAGVAVTAMLLVRRGAPEGGYFEDGDRASGVFGVLATGFSVLLGFIVFLAFTSYDQSRTGAETEALMVVQQVETPSATRAVRAPAAARLLRAVGPATSGRACATARGDASTPGDALFQTMRPSAADGSEQSAYDPGSARRPRARRRDATAPAPSA
jgi:hypothetical protein